MGVESGEAEAGDPGGFERMVEAAGVEGAEEALGEDWFAGLFEELGRRGGAGGAGDDLGLGPAVGHGLAPTCLRMIAQYYGKIYSLDFLRDKTSIGRNGVSISGIAEAAEMIGLQSLSVAATFDMLAHDMPLPCIAYWKQRHFVIVREVKPKQSFWSKIRRKKSDDWEIHLADPAYGLITYSKDEFMRGWIGKKNYNEESDEGIILALEPTPQFFQIESSDEAPPTKRRFSHLFAYFKPYKKIIRQLIIGLIISSIIQLTSPFLMQSTIDYGVNFQNINFLYVVLFTQLVLFLSDTSVQLLRGWLLMHMTSRIRIRLLTHFLAKLMTLSIGFFDTKNVGDIMQRIQDNDRIESFLSNTTLNTLFSFFNLFIFGGILAYFNTTIFLIFLISAIVQVLWTLIFLKKRAEIDYKRFDQAAGNQSSTMQLINGMQEIRLNGSEKRRRWEWESVQIRLFRISMKSLTLAQTQNSGGSFINESKNILITFFTATSVINGQMTLGTMLSIQYIIGQLNLPISNFISFVQIAQDAKISLDRLNEIYDKDDEEPLHQSFLKELPQDKSICIRNLSFRYGSRDSALVLKNLDLDIPAGKTTAIVGASGSGKTTLIKLLLKFSNPTEGVISYFNFWSENQNVKQGDEIFSIIPKNQKDIIGKVLLPTQRSGKLKIGQKAIIKLDNFPFAEFGVLEGTVKHISSIPKQNQYAVEIAFNNKLMTNTGTIIIAKNDIQGSVDIVTEDLRLIERIFYQIRKFFL